jgi:hypothetical protein
METYLEEGLRECDTCAKVTDAGDYPDWPNGECEQCDPRDCVCGQDDPLPFTHGDGCPIWENRSTEWEIV